MEPDPWQRDLLTSTHKRIILNCSRQSGKSTIVAILALHHALLNPRAFVAIVSPSQRQSTELLRKVSDFYRLLGQPGSVETDSATTLELRNGSRIAALPGSEATTRGFTASLILIDEAAQVSEQLYRSVRPSLAVSQGRLILLSTPYGKQGTFWHAWNQPGWNKVKVTADQCPRIAKEFLDEERRALGSAWFAQEYWCEFVQDDASIFKEAWIQYYDPADRPYVDTIIQSWDTAQTKSSSSSFMVGQVWGRNGADFYLLDQVRGRYDFDETIMAIKELSKRWPTSTAKLVEAQALGAAVVTHLKHTIPGLIPITVKGSKELRARDCVPVWQSKNVYIPKPDDGEYAWVYEYEQELLNFPNVAHDDQVDATTLALNQLHGSLFRKSKERVVETVNSQPLRGHDYFIGWVLGLDTHTVLVFDRTDFKVVHFGRYLTDYMKYQIEGLAQLSRYYNHALVRAFDRNQAVVSMLEMQGVWVERVTLTRSKLEDSYENLAALRAYKMITVSGFSELQAELDVFKSGLTLDGSADYSLQVAQQSGIHALCLVTYDLTPEMIDDLRQPSIYYSYDPDLEGYIHFG
jgi:predicted phage terminase large subunit-like protein